jgi:hypothetical protein
MRACRPCRRCDLHRSEWWRRSYDLRFRTFRKLPEIPQPGMLVSTEKLHLPSDGVSWKTVPPPFLPPSVAAPRRVPEGPAIRPAQNAVRAKHQSIQRIGPVVSAAKVVNDLEALAMRGRKKHDTDQQDKCHPRRTGKQADFHSFNPSSATPTRWKCGDGFARSRKLAIAFRNCQQQLLRKRNFHGVCKQTCNTFGKIVHFFQL